MPKPRHGFLKAGCKNCMEYKPENGSRFKCGICGTVWNLANVSPGNYYEPEGGYTEVEHPDKDGRYIPKVLSDWWNDTPQPNAEAEAAFNEHSEGAWDGYVSLLTEEEWNAEFERLQALSRTIKGETKCQTM